MKHDTPAVRIASTRPGFWRCGRQHGTEPVVHPAGTFSEVEIERLRAEPALIVDVDPAPEAANSGEAATGIFEQALDALRAAPAGEVREFFGRMSEDPEIRAKVETEIDRQSQMIAAIAVLDPDNPDHFTKSGKPEIKALENAAGLDDISAADRDAAWDEYQKAKQ